MPDQTPEFVSLDEYRAPVEPAARQHAEDLNASYRLSHEALAMRHARTLSALRTVWASRRRHQKRASDMLAEDFGAAESRVRELEAERDKLARLLAAESARVAELEAQQQPRVITDPEELSALPAGALVHDGTAVFDHLGAGWWVTTGSADPIHSEAILEAEPDGTCGCTVIVLWTPEADIQSDIRILLLGKEFEARAAIDRARKLHQPENGCDNPVHTVPDATCPQCCDYCQCCGEAMPCATIRAIDGEDSRFPTPKAGDFTGGVR